VTDELRTLTADDADQAFDLSTLAFNGSPDRRTRWIELFDPASTTGVFERGRLVAMARARSFQQYWGGRLMPMCGVASVAVMPHRRGAGLGRRVVAGALDIGHERGDPLSALFPTAPAVYRSLGWEIAGDRTWLRVPTASLRTAGSPAGGVRPAEPTDLAAISACYSELARETNGAIERDSSRWQDQLGLGDAKAEAYVVGAETGVDGVLVYRRGRSEDLKDLTLLEVGNLFARRQPELSALLGVLGAATSVASHVTINIARAPLAALLPNDDISVHDHESWMLRLLDAPAAIAARGYPVEITADVDIELIDPQVPGNSGRWRLRVADGKGGLEPGGSGTVRMDPRGAAALYAGRLPAATLRRLGLLDGGERSAYDTLTAVFAGPPAHMWDYF
jgi:predicted acetyltransferase